MSIFSTKYKKADDDTKVLLIHLILNGFDMSKVSRLVEEEDSRMFGLSIRKVYGITKEYVDVKGIDADVESIAPPTVCSPQSYEYYANSKIVYSFMAEEKKFPLYINDMGVISKTMVITPTQVVSDNPAKSFTESGNLGFMFFFDYVLKSEVVIGNWRMTYKDNTFNIDYMQEENGKKWAETLYSALEIDKTTTYKMVIYVIKRVSLDIPEWTPDNFVQTAYNMVKTD